jgi:hypothetical protein
MMKHSQPLFISRLDKALLATFEWLADAHDEGGVPDIAGAWGDMLASSLNDARITDMPPVDDRQTLFPFVTEHRLNVTCFDVLRAGLGGGPTVDLLFQLWFDTEDVQVAWGVPLIFHRIPANGRLTDLEWLDLREGCKHLCMATGSGRIVFMADHGYFDWYNWIGEIRRQRILVMDAATMAGTRSPPLPVFGRSCEAFCLDLAAGWIGDPSLSGRARNSLLDDLLETCHVRQILRIHVTEVHPSDRFAPQKLPL